MCVREFISNEDENKKHFDFVILGGKLISKRGVCGGMNFSLAKIELKMSRGEKYVYNV